MISKYKFPVFNIYEYFIGSQKINTDYGNEDVGYDEAP